MGVKINTANIITETTQKTVHHQKEVMQLLEPPYSFTPIYTQKKSQHFLKKQLIQLNGLIFPATTPRTFSVGTRRRAHCWI